MGALWLGSITPLAKFLSIVTSRFQICAASAAATRCQIVSGGARLSKYCHKIVEIDAEYEQYTYRGKTVKVTDVVKEAICTMQIVPHNVCPIIAYDQGSNNVGSTTKNPSIDMIATRPTATTTSEYPAYFITAAPRMSSVMCIQNT